MSSYSPSASGTAKAWRWSSLNGTRLYRSDFIGRCRYFPCGPPPEVPRTDRCRTSRRLAPRLPEQRASRSRQRRPDRRSRDAGTRAPGRLVDLGGVLSDEWE
jgi:hypothetical protein